MQRKVQNKEISIVTCPFEPFETILLLLFELYIFKSYKPAYSKANLGGSAY